MGQDFLANIKFAIMGKEEAVAAGQQVKQAIDGIKKPTEDVTRATNDFEKAFRRALIVAPVWMVAREAMKQTIQFVKDGIQYYLETEKAMHNVVSTLNELGIAGTISIGNLVEKFHSLSMETGKSEASIANAFAGVNRILQDTSKSYLAVNEATKLSIATGGDAGKLAETMAFLYKLQGSSLKEAATDTQKFNDIATLLYITQSKMPGGWEALSSGLTNFNAQMSISDFGLENSIRLIGALGAAGITSGQTLKTGLMKVLTNLDETEKMLGISLPQGASSVEKLQAVLNRLSEIRGQENFFTILKDIFGATGSRGSAQIVALTKDMQTFNAALSGKGVSGRERDLYNQQIREGTNEVGHQLEIFTNLKKQIGEAFVVGVGGGKDFAQAMKNINEAAQSPALVAWFQGLGLLAKFGVSLVPVVGQMTAWNDQMAKVQTYAQNIVDLNNQIKEALKGQMNLMEVNTLIGEVSTTNLIKDEARRKSILDHLKEQSIILASQHNAETKLTAEVSKRNVAVAEQAALTKKQADEVDNLIIKYAKANGPEKAKIQRQLEIMQMPEAQQVQNFNNLGSERGIMLDMIKNFSTDVQDKIRGIIVNEAGGSLGVTRYGGGSRADNNIGWGGAVGGGGMGKPGQQLISINPDSIATINVAITAEATSKVMNDSLRAKIKEVLEKDVITDEDLMKLFGRALSNKI